MDVANRTLVLCRELVRHESLSGQEGAVADAVEREMKALGYDEVERDELGSVVGVVAGARPGARVLLDAHMDVVPATEPERWRYPPFSAARAEGRIWGRGTTDIKGSLAALVVAIGTLPRAELAGTLVVSASVGEEKVEGLAVAVMQHVPETDAEVGIVRPLRLRQRARDEGRGQTLGRRLHRGALRTGPGPRTDRPTRPESHSR